MRYCVAEINIEKGKPVVRFRDKDGFFYWEEDVNCDNVIWSSEENAKRFSKLKAGRAIIPENSITERVPVTPLVRREKSG